VQSGKAITIAKVITILTIVKVVKVVTQALAGVHKKNPDSPN
jgi:hypothetical protein